MERNIYLRPWGFYDILHSEPGIQIKRIHVEPGKRLSLQTHAHRSEHWYVIDGFGFVTVEGQVFELTPGDSVTIDVGEQHRVEGRNVGITFIEIQKGDIIDEDDIVRIEDDFGRA